MMGRKKAELVDLTQEDVATRRASRSPITITLDDSIHCNHRQQPQQQQRQHQPSSQSPPILIDVSDSESEEGQPIRKRHFCARRTSTPKTQRPPSIRPIPRPETPDDSLKCPICIEPYKNVKKAGSKVVVTRCGHLFCESCLKKAFHENGRHCPKCRKTIPRSAAAVIEIYDVC